VTSSPYRENADAAPGLAPRRRWFVLVSALGLVGVGAALAWLAVPWTSRVELRVTQEATGEHSPFRALYWNDDGTRALAVGSEGGVFERSSAVGDVAHPRWQRLASGTREQLLAVAGGDGPVEGRGIAPGPPSSRCGSSPSSYPD